LESGFRGVFPKEEVSMRPSGSLPFRGPKNHERPAKLLVSERAERKKRAISYQAENLLWLKADSYSFLPAARRPCVVADAR